MKTGMASSHETRSYQVGRKTVSGYTSRAAETEKNNCKLVCERRIFTPLPHSSSVLSSGEQAGEVDAGLGIQLSTETLLAHHLEFLYGFILIPMTNACDNVLRESQFLQQHSLVHCYGVQEQQQQENLLLQA